MHCHEIRSCSHLTFNPAVGIRVNTVVPTISCEDSSRRRVRPIFVTSAAPTMQAAYYRRLSDVENSCNLQCSTIASQTYLAQPCEHPMDEMVIFPEDRGWHMTQPTSTYILPMATKENSLSPLLYQSCEQLHNGTPPDTYGLLSSDEPQLCGRLLPEPGGSNLPICPITIQQTYAAEVLHPRLWEDDFGLRLPTSNTIRISPESTNTSSLYGKRQHGDKEPELCTSGALTLNSKALADGIGSQPHYKSGSNPQNTGEHNISEADGTSESNTKQRFNQSHSFAERKYRENLNAKFTELNSALGRAQYCPPCTASTLLKGTTTLTSDNTTDLEVEPLTTYIYSPSSCHTPKASIAVRKSRVMSDAIDYINRAELEMRHMETEIMELKCQVKSLKRCSTRASARLPR